MTTEHIKWMLYGIGALLVIKYGVVGLHHWNNALHPGRQDDPSGMFYCPLLGIMGCF
jgi:hypothetical protein